MRGMLRALALCMDNATAADRIEYRRLRASCDRHDAKSFDDIARGIASELSDGEEMTSGLWVSAARIICSGQDYA